MSISRHLLLALSVVVTCSVTSLMAQDAAPAAPAPAAPAPAAPAAPGAPAAAPAAAPSVIDFGDSGSATLTTKAWAAYQKQDWAAADAYTKKCQELYGAKALEMAATVTEAPPKETANSFWAMNDVGTCYFIQGQAYEKQGKTPEAIAAYKVLVEKMPFAQCWDPKGWFWKPADAARKQLKMLEFGSL
jgi:hypothetical protein